MNIARRKPLTARVGIFGVGLDTYWEQFPGLLDDLLAKKEILKRKLSAHSVELFDFGMVDNAERAAAALPQIEAADLDLLFVDMLTYATSATFGMIVRRMQIPVVLVALQPLPAMDYEHASTYMQLCNDDFCSVPEFTGVAVRMGKKAPAVVLGQLEGDAVADAELAEWCRVAHVLHDLRRARFGHMGHVLEAMLDMQTDPAAVTAAFGAHVVQCEADQLLPIYREVDPAGAEVAEMKRRILSFFDTPDPVSDPLTEKLTEADLETAAVVAVTLERYIALKHLDGLAYYYEAEPGSLLRRIVTNFIVGNSLLTAAGFPMCGEFDIKTCIAMLIFDRLEIGGLVRGVPPGRLCAGHGPGRPRRAASPEHRERPPGHPQSEEVPRQTRFRGRGRVQHQNRPDHDAERQFERRREVQVRRRRRRIDGGADPADREHEHAREVQAGCPDLPETLGGGRPDASFRARNRPPCRNRPQGRGCARH